MMHIPVRRFGGDDTTSYNWRIESAIARPDGISRTARKHADTASACPTALFDLFHKANLPTGTVSLGTISLMDWTPKAAGEMQLQRDEIRRAARRRSRTIRIAATASWRNGQPDHQRPQRRLLSP